MKFIRILLASCLCTFIPLQAQIPQGNMVITPDNGFCNLDWEGVSGRTYFIQYSFDLNHWYYLPDIQVGYGTPIAYWFQCGADEAYLRLQYTDLPTGGDPYGSDFDGDGYTNFDEISVGASPFVFTVGAENPGGPPAGGSPPLPDYPLPPELEEQVAYRLNFDIFEPEKLPRRIQLALNKGFGVVSQNGITTQLNGKKYDFPIPLPFGPSGYSVLAQLHAKNPKEHERIFTLLQYDVSKPNGFVNDVKELKALEFKIPQSVFGESQELNLSSDPIPIDVVLPGTSPSRIVFPMEILTPKNEGSEELVHANDLKIAKMKGGQDIVDGLNVGEIEYLISGDRDRFYLKLKWADFDADISVLLQTTHNDDDYADLPTKIELKYDSEEKHFVSESMVLVADSPDDIYDQGNHADDIIDENEIPKDNTDNDRTHISALGGKVKISSVTIGEATSPVSIERSVKVKKKVDVTIWRIQAQGAGNPYVDEGIVNQHVKKMKERYAQVGLEINVIGPKIKIIPNNVVVGGNNVPLDLSDGYQVQDAGMAGESMEEIAFLEAVATPNVNDIEIFYVGLIADVSSPDDESATGYSYSPSKAGVVSRPNSIVMSKTAPQYVLPHELGHILLNSGTHNYPSTRHLMNGAVAAELPQDFDNSKRLRNDEELIMHQHPQVKNP